jgi:hypothetical protein
LTKTGDAAIQRDAATMLGILCNEVHPDEINAKVCTALLSVLSFSSTNVMVRNEILNVLMDVYGDDELYAKVFEQKDVLGHFQQSLPVFRRDIKEMERRDDATREDTEIWRETALNTSRFIKYKKDRV